MHVPFCFHKCHYCDFYSIVDRHDRQEAFCDRLIREIEGIAPHCAKPLETIFIGGGTPTLLRVELWERLLEAMGACLPLTPDGEFSVEANPETLTADLLSVLVGGRVNRLSVGAQSFNNAHLKTLERWHDPLNVGRAVKLAREAGIDNVNLDLIFAVPGQTLDDWRDDLARAIDLRPEHLSCYGLMYEPNTPLTQRMHAGAVQPVEHELEASMYEATIEALDGAGHQQYEISNWSKPRRQCRHNMLYWRNKNWWALGPSASGHMHGVRWKNIPRLTDYLHSGGWMSPVIEVERADEPTRAGEEFMLGLRLREGLAHKDVDQLIARSGARGGARRDAIDRHLATGLLERDGERLRLTRRGMLLANEVLVDLV